MTSTPLERASFAPPAEITGWRRIALLFGAAGCAATIGGLWFDRSLFFQAYLVAFLFWLSITLGCLGVLMLHHLSRGAWGLLIRRPLEAAARTLPLMMLLFLPIVAGLGDLFPWARPEAANDPILVHKAPYLNVPFFLVRAGIYFAVWTLLSWRLHRMSREQDVTGDPTLFRRMQRWSATGLLGFVLTATFASFDWMMSVDPHWFSSLYGFQFIAGTALSAFAFVIPVLVLLSRRAPLAGVVLKRHLHDHGKLLFAFVMFWAYLAASQLIIIWSGNLPEEIPFYLERLHGSWKMVSVLMIVAHFALPFVLLLSGDLKRSGRRLAWVALWLLAMRWLDTFWQVTPALRPHGVGAGLWLDLAAVVGLGGLWLFAFFGQLARQPLLPVRDPYLQEALADGH